MTINTAIKVYEASEEWDLKTSLRRDCILITETQKIFYGNNSVAYVSKLIQLAKETLADAYMESLRKEDANS